MLHFIFKVVSKFLMYSATSKSLQFFFVNASDFDDDPDVHVEVDRSMVERISQEGTVYIVHAV